MELRQIIRVLGCSLALFSYMLFLDLSTALAGRIQVMHDEYKMLNGTVMGIDPKSHTVTVDVKTFGCEGEKTFYVDDMRQLQAEQGDMIKFFVDSQYCPAAVGHRMFPQEKGRKPYEQ